MSVAGGSIGAWEETLAHEIVEGGTEVAALVPDLRLDGVVASVAKRGLSIRTLTREEECVGYAAGFQLAGGRPIVLMQCSGLGNALNALGSLVIPYGLGLPLVLSMRGSLGEENPSQIPMGRGTRGLLDALGIQSFSIRNLHDVGPIAQGVLRMSSEAGACAAMILEPELGGGREYH